jgi:hypothetical protein
MCTVSRNSSEINIYYNLLALSLLENIIKVMINKLLGGTGGVTRPARSLRGLHKTNGIRRLCETFTPLKP